MIDTKSELSSVRGKLQDEREKLRLLQQRNSGVVEAAAIATLEAEEKRLLASAAQGAVRASEEAVEDAKGAIIGSREAYQKQLHIALKELVKLCELGKHHELAVQSALAAVSAKANRLQESGQSLYDPRTGGRTLSDLGMQLQGEQNRIRMDSHLMAGFTVTRQEQEAMLHFHNL